MTMKVTKEQVQLYAVTDRSWLRGRSILEVVEEAIDGGATIVQLRDKDGVKDLEEARQLCALCRSRGVLFIINDSVEVAKAVDADGVHLGLDDGDLLEARRILGEGKIIGASTHNREEAIAAERAGADYLGCGAIFGSSTKNNVVHITPDILREVTSSVSVPVVAIGGITRENLPTLNGCGLAGAAVISAIFAAEDIKAAAEELSALTAQL